MIVPRHPQRFDEVAALLAARGVAFARRSADAAVAADVRVVLGDTLGELPAYYAAADVAFVGGSLLPFGGQNLIEAIAVGTPTLVGPHTFNFTEAAANAIAAGAALRVADADALVARSRGPHVRRRAARAHARRRTRVPRGAPRRGGPDCGRGSRRNWGPRRNRGQTRNTELGVRPRCGQPFSRRLIASTSCSVSEPTDAFSRSTAIMYWK